MNSLFSELRYALGDRCNAIKITMVEKTVAVIKGCEITDNGFEFLDDEVVVENELLVEIEFDNSVLTENDDLFEI